MPRSSQPAQSPPQPRRSAFTLIEMVVVVGIIGTLMALGVPGIVSSIKKADANATTSIIGTLHSQMCQAAREYQSVSGNWPNTYTLVITMDKVVFRRNAATRIEDYEVGKSFNFTSDVSGMRAVSFLDAFRPESYTVTTTPGAGAWTLSGSPVLLMNSSDVATGNTMVITYMAKTGFVTTNGTTIAKMALTLRDKNKRKMILTFWPTGAYNVTSG